VAFLPPIDQKLLVALSEKFPDKAPDITLSEKDVWYRSGQVAVVRWLYKQYEEQSQNPLGTEVI
tara:strand:- start:2435 stop:2626 length:192 start_codon:yes stop_codon:yes gene_type:complete